MQEARILLASRYPSTFYCVVYIHLFVLQLHYTGFGRERGKLWADVGSTAGTHAGRLPTETLKEDADESDKEQEECA